MSLLPLLLSEIRSRGPMTAAEFMELALYHPSLGYYSRAEQRSGRAGDFYTSVDVGPLFGEMIAAQLAEMWEVLRSRGAEAFDIVEAGAGNGRLARDVMDRAAREFPEFYRCIRLTLVERSAAARGAQAVRLGPHVGRVAEMRTSLPTGVTGVIYANELLDAFPVHVVTRTPEGLREIAVSERDGMLVESLMPLSSEHLVEHLRSADVVVDVGARVEVALAASAWVAGAAEALSRGFLLLFDYGREAHQLCFRLSRRHADDVSWASERGRRLADRPRRERSHGACGPHGRAPDGGSLRAGHTGHSRSDVFSPVAGPCRAARDRT